MIRWIPWLFCFTLTSFAGERALVRYFIQINPNAVVPFGDFDGKSTVHLDTDVDSSLVPETVGVPEAPVFFELNTRLGVYIDAHSLSAGIGFARPMITEGPSQLPFNAQHASWLSFQVEYQYNFLYPGTIRPSFGVSYGFARFGLEGNSVSEEDEGDKVGDALFSGTGPGMVTGLGWYPLWNLCVKGEVRGRYYNMKNITTTANDFGQLEDGLNLFLLDFGISAQWVF